MKKFATLVVKNTEKTERNKSRGRSQDKNREHVGCLPGF